MLRNQSYVPIQYFVKNLRLKSLWRKTSICIWLYLFDLIFLIPWRTTENWTHEKLCDLLTLNFLLRRKPFLGLENREYVDNCKWRDFYGKIKLVSYWKWSLQFVSKQTNVCMSAWLHVSLRSNTSEIGL